MQDINEALFTQMSGYFCCDKRRLTLISHMIVGLLKLTQSSLSKWSKALPGEQQLEAKYKQLQRFARFFRFSPRLYAGVVWGLFGQQKVVYLTLDRSEWQMRGKWVQVVLVGITHQGMSIPLLWQVLNRQGNTATTTRKALLHCFDAWLDRSAGQVIWWLADREYVGKEWFQELSQRKMRFCIRLRKSVRVQQGRKQLKLAHLFACSRLRTLTKPRQVYGCKLYLAGQQLPNGDLFVVGSATKSRQLATIYQKRWQIETLFAAYKSRGFNLESCRVNQAKRLKTLLFVLSLAALWAIQTGLWLIAQGKKIPLKNFKNQAAQKWKSLFRWGLDYLQNVTLNNLPYPPMPHFCPVVNMIDMTAGIFYEVDKKTKELRQIAEGLKGGDGIIPYGKDFIISNWNGEINYVTAAGQVTKLLDTKAEKVNAADIEYIPEQNVLLVPTFFANKVVAYQVKK